uniref:ATP synthase subunit a n=1 Tax=Solenostomus cyanopterus TaxID=270527 RepID=A7BHR6_9TELE|nr:ATP synthase F0 subunit 6 [Solenostomus cyanopterus]BAF74891.1 ATPase subunit 6 [Solenostomus cyanopterus]BBU25688.1 ATPase subunit 6 [Solenostomus cyanopterus]
MMASFFDQFNSPSFLSIPLVVIALATPAIMAPAPSSLWLNNRFHTLQAWFMAKYVNQLLSPISPKAHKWATMFMALMLYITTLNILGLLPYTFTPTTQLSLNLGLAVPLWLATVLIGARNQLTHSLGHMLPEGTPTALIPVLIIIETISLFIRPIALAVRLTANLTAGHLLIQLTATAVFFMMSSMPAVSMVVSVLLLMLSLLEVAVALIQAYVFVLLLSLYLQENT